VKITDDNVLPFYYVPQLSKYVSRNFAITRIGSMPVLTLLHNPLKNPFNSAVKRTFDILFSSIVLLLSPIIFIPVAIGIKLSSPGPIFFKQERTGHLGRSFNCYKFRTMRVNASADTAQATKDDPRKTKFGDFLRRSSIDELPQFFNVWRGDMSVVGPRPHMLKHTELYSSIISSYMVRHVVRPGITGWAQVNGYRGITDELWKMEKRVECDVWYIEHWNFFLDLKIIVRTVFNAIGGESNAF
jgi:putative colanic acid biosynthesis UDP-glucose lipid carrier transferase